MSLHQLIIKGTKNIFSKEKERRREDNEDKNRTNDYPKTCSGFQCFVCGTRFTTNEERIQHLEKEPHGGMYDTCSPQEREESRRSRTISSSDFDKKK
jgi:hypothetical protein